MLSRGNGAENIKSECCQPFSKFVHVRLLVRGKNHLTRDWLGILLFLCIRLIFVATKSKLLISALDL